MSRISRVLVALTVVGVTFVGAPALAFAPGGATTMGVGSTGCCRQ